MDNKKQSENGRETEGNTFQGKKTHLPDEIWGNFYFHIFAHIHKIFDCSTFSPFPNLTDRPKLSAGMTTATLCTYGSFHLRTQSTQVNITIQLKRNRKSKFFKKTKIELWLDLATTVKLSTFRNSFLIHPRQQLECFQDQKASLTLPKWMQGSSDVGSITRSLAPRCPCCL